jgi:hypothetical protein
MANEEMLRAIVVTVAPGRDRQCTWLEGSTKPYVRCEKPVGSHPSWCGLHHKRVFLGFPMWRQENLRRVA